jgi:hypothetical protein
LWECKNQGPQSKLPVTLGRLRQEFQASLNYIARLSKKKKIAVSEISETFDFYIFLGTQRMRHGLPEGKKDCGLSKEGETKEM